MGEHRGYIVPRRNRQGAGADALTDGVFTLDLPGATESPTAFSLKWSDERGDHDCERRGHEDEFSDALHLAPLG